MFKCVLVTSSVLLISSNMLGKVAFPNVCDVINSPTFNQTLDFQTSSTTCHGFPPRPCAQISYYVPKYFIEVVSNPAETFFRALPGVNFQLARVLDRIPYGVEANSGSYSYHAHALNIPFSQWAFNELPCGGTVPDIFCFSAMSEHLGLNWKTGKADLAQPAFLAWAANPKLCIAYGAAKSLAGQNSGIYGGTNPTCSFPMGWLPKYPPSSAPICTGWGIHFPRSGTVTSSDQLTASLVIASRIKSLGAEVFQTLSASPDEKWQMVLPNQSASFFEGENVSWLLPSGVHELGRFRGPFKNYLYAVWQKTTCVQDWPAVWYSRLWIAFIQSACKGV